MEKITFDLNRNVLLVHSFIAGQTVLELIKLMKGGKVNEERKYNMIENREERLEGQKGSAIWEQSIVDLKMTMQQLVDRFVRM